MPASGNLRAVLISPRNPLNIGAAARAMSNFGFFHLRLVNAYDVAFREAKSAVNMLETAQAWQRGPCHQGAVLYCFSDGLVLARGFQNRGRPVEQRPRMVQLAPAHRHAHRASICKRLDLRGSHEVVKYALKQRTNLETGTK